MKNQTFIDIHCHSVMTHYRNPEQNKNAGEEVETKISEVIDAVFGKESLRSYTTQSDFGKLAHGNVSAILISLYPIERMWFLPKANTPVLKETLISIVTGFSKKTIVKLMREKGINYYSDLEGEYNYLLSQVDKQYSGKNFKIAIDYNQYESNRISGNSVSIIISIEGGHALGVMEPSDLEKKPEKVNEDDYKLKFRPNLFKLKSWGPNNNGSHSPLYITLSHHFWNLLAGHCESLSFIFNQKTGKETGLTAAGRMMIEDLLSDQDSSGNPNKSRRILIDVKHMSPLARKQYYDYLKERKKKTGLNIPVICSHAAVGDVAELNCLIAGTDENKKFKLPKTYFNTSTLSLVDEDIKEIVNSDGLIGMILHETRVASKDALKKDPYRIAQKKKVIRELEIETEKLKKSINANAVDAIKIQINNQIESINAIRQIRIRELREAYVCMIMANLYRVAEVAGKKGWDHVCLGSDFDGTINKLDFLGTSEDFGVMTELMLEFMKKPQSLDKFNPAWTENYLKKLHFKYQPEQLIEKFSAGNVNAFLKKYFTEDYLIKGINPVS